MAIDTAAKRKSCIGLATPWNRPGVVPDGGNLSAAQRLHTDALYSGIAAGAPGGVAGVVLERSAFRFTFGRTWGRVN
jgi:hypothetical protein